MGQSGEGSAFDAAVQAYLQSDLGRDTPSLIAERLSSLEPGLSGARGAVSARALHMARLGLEALARKDARPLRIFLAIAEQP